MIADIHWGSLGTVGQFGWLLVVPGAVTFHRKVVRPMKWLRGVPADEAADGKAIPPLNIQLRDMRLEAEEAKRDIASIKTRLDQGDAKFEDIDRKLGELKPNGGTSVADKVNEILSIVKPDDNPPRA